MPLIRRHRKRPATGNATSEEPDRPGDEPVNILRFLHPDCIALDLETRPTPVDPDESEGQRERRLVHDKEALLQEFTDLMDRSGNVVNPTKFYKDMVNRERKATTAIAPGIAIPHVRSMQVRNFTMGFARAPGAGFPFASLDGGPTRLFFILAAPPYDDRLYLRVYRQFAEMIQHDWIIDSFTDAQSEQDVRNILRGYVAQ